ncbi:MAG: MBL fold metallo-hydrolase [Anaerolineales bacterium]|nr:MBL fold metallo-hydrolase [Anaerolineales bacterium]
MDNQLLQLTESTWLFPHHPNFRRVQASIGVVTSGDETLLVDAGNGPATAKHVKKAIQDVNLPEVTQIVYTHHHWDHVYGACEFDVSVVAHQCCREILLEESKKPWSLDYLREVIRKEPKLRVSFKAKERAVKNWDRFRIVVPEIIFTKSKRLRVGKVDVLLEHVGGDHADDSIVVKVPDEGVIFLGDCYYIPPLHLREPTSTISRAMLTSLADQNYSLYVEGHDAPYTRAELLEFLEGE